MKYSIIFLYLIFFVGVISASEIRISPSQINFEGKTNYEICKKINLFTSENSLILGEDRWAEKGYLERNFSEYKYPANYLDLEVIYLKQIYVHGEKNIEVCIRGKEEGVYNGILLFKVNKNPAGVGSWININLTKGENSLTKITGAVIGNEDTNGFLIILFLLLIVLLFLLVKSIKK